MKRPRTVDTAPPGNLPMKRDGMPKTLSALLVALFLVLGCAEPALEQSPTDTPLPTVFPTPTIDPLLLGLAWDIVRHNPRSERKTPEELAGDVWPVYEVLNTTINQSPDPVLLGLAWEMVQHDRRSQRKNPQELSDDVLVAYEALKKTRRSTP